jgi:hypothetical protein
MSGIGQQLEAQVNEPHHWYGTIAVTLLCKHIVIRFFHITEYRVCFVFFFRSVYFFSFLCFVFRYEIIYDGGAYGVLCFLQSSYGDFSMGRPLFILKGFMLKQWQIHYFIYITKIFFNYHHYTNILKRILTKKLHDMVFVLPTDMTPLRYWYLF